MKKNYFISILLTAGIWMLGIYFAVGDFLFFFNAPCLMLTVMPAVFMSLAHFSVTEIAKSFTAAFKEQVPQKDVQVALVFFDALQKYILGSAFTGFLLGIILMLYDITHKGLFGKGVAISLLCILYGAIFIIIVTIPFKAAVLKKQNK